MDLKTSRAFSFSLVLFTLILIVSSATDEKNAHPGSKEGHAPPEPVASVPKPTEKAQTERSGETKSDSKSQIQTKATATPVKKPDAASESTEQKNCSSDVNGTNCGDDRSIVTKFWDNVRENREMLKRTMFVLLGVTGVVVVYFVIRTVRLRRRRSKSRKYGVITSRGDVEMEPLGQGEDDDEDYTVFEMNGRRK